MFSPELKERKNTFLNSHWITSKVVLQLIEDLWIRTFDKLEKYIVNKHITAHNIVQTLWDNKERESSILEFLVVHTKRYKKYGRKDFSFFQNRDLEWTEPSNIIKKSLQKRLAREKEYQHLFYEWSSFDIFDFLIEQWFVVLKRKNTYIWVDKNTHIRPHDTFYIKEFKNIDFPHISSYMQPIELDIIWETEDFIIINKPRILSHSNWRRDLKNHNVQWAMTQLEAERKNIPIDEQQKFTYKIVHRLDVHTTWLMIVAKSQNAYDHFKKEFYEKTQHALEWNMYEKLQKQYTATCKVHPKYKEDIENVTQRLPLKIVNETHSLWNEARKNPTWVTTITSIQKTDHPERWTIYEVKIDLWTWRNQQIRAHLKDLWLYIVWDSKYQKSLYWNELVPIQRDRSTKTQLMASWLSFMYQWKKYTYSI